MDQDCDFLLFQFSNPDQVWDWMGSTLAAYKLDPPTEVPDTQMDLSPYNAAVFRRKRRSSGANTVDYDHASDEQQVQRQPRSTALNTASTDQDTAELYRNKRSTVMNMEKTNPENDAMNRNRRSTGLGTGHTANTGLGTARGEVVSGHRSRRSVVDVETEYEDLNDDMMLLGTIRIKAVRHKPGECQVIKIDALFVRNHL